MGLFKRLFFDYEWICAIRKCEPNEAYIPSDYETRKYSVLTMPKGYWAADPFIYCHNGLYCVFFEYFDKKHDKAYICGTKINSPDKKVFEVYEFRGHSSYPHIFELNGVIYMMPETCAEKKLCLLKCVSWPDKWEEDVVLLDNCLAVDSTTFKIGERLFVMSFLLDKLYSNCGDLFIGELKNTPLRICNFQKVVNGGNGDARPGGCCFNIENRLIRVVQPWGKIYGERIEFYEIVFDGINYREEKIGTFTPNQVGLDKNVKIDGIHTFNRFDDYEVIDARTKFRFDLFKPFKKVFKLLGLFGFKNCDKRMEYVDDKFKS